MANILTAAKAASALRCDVDDPEMLNLLPLVDDFVKSATGRDWAADSPVHPKAESAARMMIVRWHEDPGGMAAGDAPLGFGLTGVLVQLEALALELESSGVPEKALAIDKSMPEDGSDEIATTVSCVLVFNHAMASVATTCVHLEDADGNTVASTNSLDVTGKIMTVNPTGSLSADSAYTLVIEAAADIYGWTLSCKIKFRTA